jgi:hypothetical protein
VVRRAAHAAVGFAGVGPVRRGHVVRDDQPAGARHHVRGADHRGVRGHDRRRELARRRHGRQHHQGKEDDERPLERGRVREAGARKLSLEQSLEFCREDECVEVTPDAIRMRKVALTQIERSKLGRKSKS